MKTEILYWVFIAGLLLYALIVTIWLRNEMEDKKRSIQIMKNLRKDLVISTKAFLTLIFCIKIMEKSNITYEESENESMELIKNIKNRRIL